MDEQINLANIHFQNQNFDEAIKVYDELIKRNNQNYILFCNRSAALYKKSRFKESLEDSIKAIQLNPKSIKAHFREGMALKALNKPIDSIIAFSRGLVIDKNNSQILSNLLSTLEQTTFYSSIEPSLKQLKSIESTLNPFLIVSLIGQHILTLNYYLESSILLDCCLKMDTDSLKLKSSIYASLSVAYWRLNNKYDLAINAMKNDLNCVIKLNDLNGQYRALTNLGLAYYHLGKFEESFENYKAQLDVAKLLDDKFKILDTLKSIGNVQQQLKQFSNSIETFEEFLELAKQENDFNSILKGLKSLAYLFVQLDEHSKAVHFQEQFCKLIESVSHLDQLKPKAYLELSDLYEQTSDFEKAIETLQNCIISNKECDKKFELIVYEKMADLSFKLKNYQQSIDLNEKLLMKLNDSDKKRRIKILNNLAECQLNLNEYTKSIEYFKERLKLDQSELFCQKKLDAMKKLSICYKKTNQLDDTLKLYFDILNYSKKFDDIDAQLWSFFNIGLCYYTNGAFDQAISIFLEYLTILDETTKLNQPIKEQKIKIYHTLALIYFKMTNLKESFNYFKKDLDLMNQLKEQLNDLDTTIDLDNLTDKNVLLACTKICCLLISPKINQTVDEILNSFNELNI